MSVTYLTQAQIDFSVAAKRGLRDSYDWHQAVWQAFPGRDGAPRDFLTRLDEQDEAVRLLIVSPREPVRPDWCPTDSWKSKMIPEGFFNKARYRFKLRVNPTKKVAVQKPDGTFKTNGRRIPLVKREDLETWLNRKAQHGGFEVEASGVHILQEKREYFLKEKTPDTSSKHGLHSSVNIEGILQVTDPEKFHSTFCQGIGSAKAFGFGLLVLAPI